MTDFKILAVSGIVAYLLYLNIQKENTIPVQTDITQPKKEPVKENVPIVSDERPKPPKMIAISQMQTNIINDKMKYNSTHGWINWDLMHRLGAGSVTNPKIYTVATNRHSI